MEAIITPFSQLVKSPREIILPDPMASANTTSSTNELNNVPQLDNFTQISVIVKVVEIC